MTPPAAPGPNAVEVRGLSKNFAEGRMGEAILEAVRKGLAMPESEAPKMEARPDVPPGLGPLIELLRVLLKTRCDQHEVAQKLVANGTAPSKWLTGIEG